MVGRTRTQINTAKDVDHDVVIGIGFLTSYEHMGMAYLECREGCKCKRKELQGMIDVKASQTDWCAELSVAVVSCGGKCGVATPQAPRPYLRHSNGGPRHVLLSTVQAVHMLRECDALISHIDALSISCAGCSTPCRGTRTAFCRSASRTRRSVTRTNSRYVRKCSPCCRCTNECSVSACGWACAREHAAD